MTDEAFGEIVEGLTEAAKTALDLAEVQNYLVEAIARRLPYYHWTGFYMLDPEDPKTLVLGPFRGAPTEHVRIPVNQGICGAAVARNETVVVDDVSADPRYLACSLETRSEIVVPIRANGTVVGEIDIDSHNPAAFAEADRQFLERCAEVMGRFLEERRG